MGGAVAYSIRRVQNRVKRESKEVKSSELQELRKKIQQLQRENSRLKKEAQKYLPPDAADPEMVPLAAIESANLSNRCPDCQGVLTQVNLGVKILTVCKLCKYRKPLNATG